MELWGNMRHAHELEGEYGLYESSIAAATFGFRTLCDVHRAIDVFNDNHKSRSHIFSKIKSESPTLDSNPHIMTFKEPIYPTNQIQVHKHFIAHPHVQKFGVNQYHGKL